RDHPGGIEALFGVTRQNAILVEANSEDPVRIDFSPHFLLFKLTVQDNKPVGLFPIVKLETRKDQRGRVNVAERVGLKLLEYRNPCELLPHVVEDTLFSGRPHSAGS